MISYMISYMKNHDVLTNLSCLAAVDRPQAQPADASDADHDPDRSMDDDEERDFADQGPLTDMDMEEDAEILALLLKHSTWKAQGTMLHVQSERPPLQGKEPSGPLCDMISYMISYLYYDIVYDMICDVLS